MLVLSIKNKPGALNQVWPALERMNLRFIFEVIDGEIAFVISTDGIRIETYQEIQSLVAPFEPIDITKLATTHVHKAEFLRKIS